MLNRTCRLLLLAAALLLTIGLSSAQAATYLVLRAPTIPRHHHQQAVGQPGIAREMVAPGYAYGWFGVIPNRQPVRHFGVQRKYTEWKFE